MSHEPLSAATLARLDRRWGDAYGVSASFWGLARIDVAPKPGDAAYRGVFIFRRQDSVVLQAPPDLGAQVSRWIAGRSPEVLFDPGYWAGLLGPRLGHTVGPALLGYIEPRGGDRPSGKALDDTPSQGVVALGEGYEVRQLVEGPDIQALEKLAVAVGAIAWEHGGYEPGQPTFGVWLDNLDAEGETCGLVSIATIDQWPGAIGHLGVVSHPAQRGKGLATIAARQAIAWGQANGLLMQYRTLAANAASRSVARHLGVAPYATTLAVRLAAPEDEAD